MTKVNREWKEDIYTLMTEFMDRKLTPEDFMMAIEVMRNDAILTTKAQTSNDLLREIMEEMPKKREGVHHLTFSRNMTTFNQAIDQVNTILERKLLTDKK